MKTIKSFKDGAIITTLFILLYIFLLITTNMSIDMSNPIRKVYFVITPLLTCLFMYEVYKSSTGKKKYFWLTILTGTFLYSIGMFIHSLNDFSFMNQQDTILELSNYLYGISIVLFSSGFLILLRTQKQKIYITQLFIDNLIILSVLITIIWVYILERTPSIPRYTKGEIIIPLIFGIIQLSGVYTLVSLSITQKNNKIDKGLIIAILSLTIHTILNFLFMATGILNSNVSIFIDVLWGLSLLGIGLSGLFSRQDNQLKNNKYKSRNTLLLISEIMPYFSVLVIMIIGISTWPNELPTVISGGIVITLLSFRQIINRIEKNQFINKLEEKIVDRTKNLQAKSKELEFLANNDSLTGLPNRRALLDKVDKSLVTAKKKGNKLGVLFIDIDDFKYLNDLLGHDGGDKLLQKVSDRFKMLLENKEGYTVFRNSGDEFIIIVENTTSTKELKSFIDNLQEEMSKNIVINGYEISLSLSIGVSIYPIHGVERESLFKAADMAMYETKNKGKKGFSIYNDRLDHKYKKIYKLKNDIDKAIEEGQFTLYYQPQYNLHREKITSVEALIRWKHPRKGLISPEEFIPIAEETGQINAIEEWVLIEACRQIKKWQEMGCFWRIAVNISPKQLFQNNFIQYLSNTICNISIDPSYLELEVTENIYVNGEYSIEKLKVLKKSGIKIAIDDFGTGFSSLKHFKKLPIDTIKINKEFVDGILSNLYDLSIIKGTITIAKSLGLNIVAEGVELEKQLEVLKYLECDMVQGYIIDKPMSREVLEDKYLQNKKMA